MAKTQTFGDKLKKKKQDEKTTVKIMKWYKDPERGTLRTLTRFVGVNDLNELDNIDIIK